MRICVALLVAVTSGDVVADHGTHTWGSAHRSVVAILPTWPGFEKPGFGAPRGTAPEGSGIVVSLSSQDRSPFILTAAHVVNNATRVQVREGDGGLLRDADVVWTDNDADIALLSSEKLRPAFQLKALDPLPGEHVCVIANPFGLGISMSCGVVSGPHRRGIGFNAVEDFIQTDAAVNPGASGGALVNAKGELLGMITAIYTKEADIDAGVNFAVSSELLVERLKLSEIR
jgi:S1-C subfamily serine protease